MDPHIEQNIRKQSTRGLQTMLAEPGDYVAEALEVAKDELIRRGAPLLAPLKAEATESSLKEKYTAVKAPVRPFFNPLVQGIARLYTDFFRPNLLFFLFAAAVPILIQMFIEMQVVSEWNGEFSMTHPVYFGLAPESVAYRFALPLQLSWLMLLSTFLLGRKSNGPVSLREFFLAVFGRIGGHFLMTFIALLLLTFGTYSLYDDIFIDGKPYPMLSNSSSGPHFLPSLLYGELSDGTMAMLSFLVVNLHVCLMYLIPVMAVHAVVRDQMISVPRSLGKVLVAILVLHLLTQGMIFMLNVEITPLILPFGEQDGTMVLVCVCLQILVHAIVLPVQLGMVSMQLFASPEPVQTVKPAAEEEDAFGD